MKKKIVLFSTQINNYSNTITTTTTINWYLLGINNASDTLLELQKNCLIQLCQQSFEIVLFCPFLISGDLK